jgi:hypothetical protein
LSCILPFCLLLTVHNTNIHAPGGIFSFVLCALCVLLCPNCPGFAFCSYCTTQHNTNIHAPVGIRTRNPSKRSTADPRLRPLSYWDRQIEPASFWLVVQCFNQLQHGFPFSFIIIFLHQSRGSKLPIDIGTISDVQEAVRPHKRVSHSLLQTILFPAPGPWCGSQVPTITRRIMCEVQETLTAA